jgi:hypothetical protein
MLGALRYPIAIAEMDTYAQDADEHFKGDEHEHLKSYLALDPEAGQIIPGTGGVRRLQWPIDNRRETPTVRVIYYFRDLNMPLYLLALYRAGERIDLSQKAKQQMVALTKALVAQYSKRWPWATLVRQDKGG